jgi:outer membrane protein OmpA-like peptidoglycan-associated protein
MKNLILVLTLVFVSSFINVFAQDEEKKCEDYPALTHLENFYIYRCNKIYSSLDIQLGIDKTKTVEGMLYTYEYDVEESKGDYRVSWLQIHRNFENAIKKINGTILFCNNESGTESFLLKKDNKEIYILVEGMGGSVDGFVRYDLSVLEKEDMKQELDASGIFNALNTDGHIALHINFETGKSIIENESQKIVNDIFDMLLANPDLKVSIEGHTDNIGNAASNKTLSENRAKAVMDALVTKGISKTRLTSKGWGSTKPISENITEEGRAANRRVDIVKM